LPVFCITGFPDDVAEDAESYGAEREKDVVSECVDLGGSVEHVRWFVGELFTCLFIHVVKDDSFFFAFGEGDDEDEENVEGSKEE